MKIKTELLQKMVAKAIQGSINNRRLPLTSLISIEVANKHLILTTTDGSNQFKINNEIELETSVYGPAATQTFYTIVNSDIFAKLVGKTTKEYIELNNNENYLEIKGNGTYKLEIAINEEGEMVKFPAVEDIQENESLLNVKDLQDTIKIAKASVAKTMEVPCLTGYYIANNIMTTDRQMICAINIDFTQDPILISSEMAELLLLVDNADIVKVVRKDNNIIFSTDQYTISGTELMDKDKYPVESIKNLVEVDYPVSIKVSRQELLNVLDRMNLFVTDYDEGGIFLTFTADSLKVESLKNSAVEMIPVQEQNGDLAEFNCCIAVEMLKSQLETISTELVEIQYGKDISIKIIDGDCTHIISLLENTANLSTK